MKGQLIIPKTLRNKNVSSRISQEIFFIDCINDLKHCAKSAISYNLIRASVLLRMLLLGKGCGLNTINENYNFNILFKANENELAGTSLIETKKINEVIEIKNTLSEFKTKLVQCQTLKLNCNPSKEYTLVGFGEKICLKMLGNKEYNFSVSNIIKIVANKNGAAHLESTFDSSTIESFHLGEFSPFSMTDGNFFIKKIQEIILILVDAVYPLSLEITKHLNEYNRSNSQSKIASANFKLIKTKEEFEKLRIN